MTPAQVAADAAADRLTRLAEDLEAASEIPAAPEDGSVDKHPVRRAVAAICVHDTRNEAAGALERLMLALPEGHPMREQAEAQGAVIRRGTAKLSPALLRERVKDWRAFADA